MQNSSNTARRGKDTISTQKQSKQFKEEHWAPERLEIVEDLKEFFQTTRESIEKGESPFANIDLSENEIAEINSKQVETDMHDKAEAYVVPETEKPPKRLRPSSVRWAGRAALDKQNDNLQGFLEDPIETEDPEQEILENLDQMSLALELYHNFTLVHDDIMDEDELRRNNPTPHVQYEEQTRKFGHNGEDIVENMGLSQAICLGDYLQELSQVAILNSDFDDSKKNEANKILKSAGIRIIQGQARDKWMELLDVDGYFQGKEQEVANFLMNEEDSLDNLYLDMIDKKTNDLYVASMDMGAMLTGASEEQRDAIRRYGRNIGTVFQIQDDIQEIRSASSNGKGAEELGKEDSDLYLGKATLTVGTAYANIVNEMKEIEENVQETNNHVPFLKERKTQLEREKMMLEHCYGNRNTTEEQMQEVADIIMKHETSSDIAQDYIHESLDYIEDADLPGDTEPLEQLAYFMKEREY